MGARVIAIVNQKGGTGKTTTAVNLGAGLSRHGRKVLLIDMDPSAGLTVSLGHQPSEIKRTIYEVLTGRSGLAEAIMTHEYQGGSYDFVPANWNLEAAEMDLADVKGRELLLHKSIAGAKRQYDYIIIDGAPRLAILAMNSLYAASELFIPIDSKYLALNGLKQLLDAVHIVNREMDHNLRPVAIMTRYNARQSMSKAVEELVRTTFKTPVLEAKIRDNVTLSGAPSYGQDIFEFDARSNGAKDYQALTEEVLAMERK